jgi:H+/Cl- antiporter ClcA
MGAGTEAPAVDPAALMRSRQYRALLVLAAIVGLIVSAASWGFLELVHEIQIGVYKDLPGDVGYPTAPAWWPLPWLALAGLLTAFAILKLPGRGGHVPAEGLKTGGRPTQPIELPGVLLAALATLGLGLVLGPEAPLIALGAGLGVLAMRRLKKDAPDQALALMAAAGSFAAISTIFGSPVIGAIVIIEATGLGGAMLPLILLPGLTAAGIGSLVFIGLGSWSGFSTSAWQLSPFPLAHFGGPGWGDFGWTILLAIAVAVITFAIMELARLLKRAVDSRPFLLTIAAGLAVGGLAIAFSQATSESPDAVLFSGQEAFGSLFGSGATIAVSTLVLLIPLQGPCLEHPPRELPRRPDLPRDLPRRRRRSDRLPPTRLCRDTGGGNAHRSHVRLDPETPAVLRHDRDPALRQRRACGDAARHRRRRRRLPHDGNTHRLRRRTHPTSVRDDQLGSTGRHVALRDRHSPLITLASPGLGRRVAPSSAPLSAPSLLLGTPPRPGRRRRRPSRS